MQEETLTLSSLAKDFEVTDEEIAALAETCGIPTSPDRVLTQEESDKLYDAWLASSVARNSNTPRGKMILMDTSSLLAKDAELCLRELAPKLLQEGRKIIVPLAVMKELMQKAEHSPKPALAKNARNIMKVIKAYRDMGVISIYGDENEERFADSVLQKAVTMFAHKYELTVITQDRDLAQDLLTMARMRSVKHRQIKVYRLGINGQLVQAQLEGVKK